MDHPRLCCRVPAVPGAPDLTQIQSQREERLTTKSPRHQEIQGREEFIHRFHRSTQIQSQREEVFTTKSPRHQEIQEYKGIDWFLRRTRDACRNCRCIEEHTLSSPSQALPGFCRATANTPGRPLFSRTPRSAGSSSQCARQGRRVATEARGFPLFSRTGLRAGHFFCVGANGIRPGRPPVAPTRTGILPSVSPAEAGGQCAMKSKSPLTPLFLRGGSEGTLSSRVECPHTPL